MELYNKSIIIIILTCCHFLLFVTSSFSFSSGIQAGYCIVSFALDNGEASWDAYCSRTGEAQTIVTVSIDDDEGGRYS